MCVIWIPVVLVYSKYSYDITPSISKFDPDSHSIFVLLNHRLLVDDVDTEMFSEPDHNSNNLPVSSSIYKRTSLPERISPIVIAPLNIIEIDSSFHTNFSEYININKYGNNLTNYYFNKVQISPLFLVEKKYNNIAVLIFTFGPIFLFLICLFSARIITRKKAFILHNNVGHEAIDTSDNIVHDFSSHHVVYDSCAEREVPSDIFVEDFDYDGFCRKVLNVEDDCSIQDIKDSYKRLARKYHPDSFGGMFYDLKEIDENGIADELRNISEAEMKKINECYEYLKENYNF